MFMKKLFCILLLLAMYYIVPAQFVAKVEIKDTDTISTLCNRKEVYALFPMFNGQEEAVCPVSKEKIEKRLNEEVAFLKENPKHKDKGMVNIMINCKGEVARCEMDNKTKNTDLDSQIVAVFNSLGEWKAGKLDGKLVDSSRLWSFEIKNGKVILN
jgi:hypothetical protein